VAVLRDTWRRANSRGDLRAALANPAYRLRRRLLGISHLPGLVAATSAGLRGISLAMIVLWWGGLVVGSAFFALVFDQAVIAVVLWQLRSGAVIS
jgi:hypothetical protein